MKSLDADVDSSLVGRRDDGKARQFRGLCGNRFDQQLPDAAGGSRAGQGARCRDQQPDGRPWPARPHLAVTARVRSLLVGRVYVCVAADRPRGIDAGDRDRRCRRTAGLKIAGVRLKWPNDLIYKDGKLGGILTEAQSQRGGAVMVVTGIGLNIDISKQQPVLRDSGWSGGIVDLKSSFPALPSVNLIAARLVSALSETFVAYEVDGFAPFLQRWREHDWLLGRELTVETPQHILTGVGAGIGDDGALLLDSPEKGRQRIRSGSVLTANVGYRD